MGIHSRSQPNFWSLDDCFSLPAMRRLADMCCFVRAPRCCPVVRLRLFFSSSARQPLGLSADTSLSLKAAAACTSLIPLARRRVIQRANLERMEGSGASLASTTGVKHRRCGEDISLDQGKWLAAGTPQAPAPAVCLAELTTARRSLESGRCVLPAVSP